LPCGDGERDEQRNPEFHQVGGRSDENIVVVVHRHAVWYQVDFAVVVHDLAAVHERTRGDENDGGKYDDRHDCERDVDEDGADADLFLFIYHSSMSPALSLSRRSASTKTKMTAKMMIAPHARRT